VYSLSSLLIVISSFCFNDVSSLYVLVLLSSSRYFNSFSSFLISRKNTAFFLGLEKTRQTKKTINELYDKNGKSTTNQNEIMEIEVDYYKKL
jgi:hypothetical protein